MYKMTEKKKEERKEIVCLSCPNALVVAMLKWDSCYERPS